MNLVYPVINARLFGVGFVAGHTNMRRMAFRIQRIEFLGAYRIFAVPLDRNGVNEVGAVGSGVYNALDLIGKHSVFRPAALIAADVLHVFDRRKRVEAEIWEYLVTIVERAGMVVHGVRRIAVFL